MGEFPKGSRIIPNAYNLIPGFYIDHHYFVPGFPVMVEPMLTWVLETHYAHLFHQREWAEKSVLVFEVAESTVTPLMEKLEADFPLIKVFSLPNVGTDQLRRHIELGVKGDPTQVQQAFKVLEMALKSKKLEFVLA
jgi:molybdopterin-biosynthesis enzyme MoeA-like protein